MKNEQNKEREATVADRRYKTIPSGLAHRALLQNSQTAKPAQPDFAKRRPGSMSRSILAMLLLTAFSVQFSAATITVTGLVSQITSEALETKITFTPAADILLLTNGLSAGPAKTISSAANGGFTNTFNPGTYLVRLPLVGGRNAFTIAVPHGNGIENITNLIAAPWTYEQFVNTVSSGGTSGALTNNDSRITLSLSNLNLRASGSAGAKALRVFDINNIEQFFVNDESASFPGLQYSSPPDPNGGYAQVDNSGQISKTFDGSSLTNLNGTEIRSGTVADARIASTITRDTELVAADTVVSNGIITGLAAGSYALKATNLITVAGSSKTNGVSILAQPLVTNSAVFVGNGSIQLPQFVYGQAGSGGVQNYRNGLIFWPNGWDGTPYAADDAVSVPMAGIQCATNWGSGDGSHISTLHIFSRGDIRIEPTYSAFPGHAAYLSLGNEDTPNNIFINQCEGGSGNRGVDGPDMAGYSLPLTFTSKGRYSNEEYYAIPAIQSYFISTNYGQADPYGNIYYPAGFKFWARGPGIDRNTNTIGTEIPTFGWEVGRTHTNGWRFAGNIEYAAHKVSTPTTTNIVLDFNSNSRQVVDLIYTTVTNYFYTTNINVYGGTTNWSDKVFRINAGALNRSLRWPSSWSVISQTGTGTLPTFLPATNFIRLHLESWGSGESNVVCRYDYGFDKSFAYDSDALNFFSRASITDSNQMGALDFLVKELKGTTLVYSNLWSKIRVLYPMVGGNSNAHAMNIRSTSYPVIYTAAGVTHDANGITGNGSSGSGNTQFTHNNAGAETNAHLVVYSRTTTPTDSGRFISAVSTTGGTTRMGLSRSGANLASDGPMNNNAPSTLGSVSTDFRGFLSVSRPNRDPNEILWTTRSASFTNSNVYTKSVVIPYALLARAFEGFSNDNYSSANLALVSIGDGLTTAELEAYRDIVNNYQTILGRNVP